MSRKFLSGGLFAALLLALAACGGPGLKAPDPPSLVAVTPGPGVLHVVWVHDDVGTTSYTVYRAPRGNPAARVKLVSVSRDPDDHQMYSYMDTTASDETKVLYSVAAVGSGGTSKAAVQTDNPPPGLAVSLKKCQTHRPTSTDSDGDGLSNAQERTGWAVSIGQGTATIDNVSGTWQQDFTSSTVKSNPHNPDTDGDGLCDLQEMMHRTDPKVADTDEDGLTDLAEIGTWASDPANVDTDIDSFNPTVTVKGNKETATINQAKGNPELYDGSEVQTYHTSPTLFDSDGDTYSDYNEILVRGSTFNPLVSNLPEIELSLSGAPYLDVDIAYSDSSKKAQTKTASLQQGQSSSHTDTSSTTWKEWASISDTVKVSAKVNDLGIATVSGSNSTTVAGGFSHVQTTGWSKTSTQSSQHTYSDATSTAREQGRSISGGEIGIGIVAKNTGDVAFTLTKLGVTALQRDPDDPSRFQAIGQLDLSKNLASGVNLAPGDATGTLDASYQTTAGNEILALMANPSSLLFDVAYFSLNNEQGISYDFMQETSDARTAFLTIDYGNGDVVRAHVASNVKRKHGKIVGVTLKEALDILGIPYKTQKTTDENGKSYTVLTELYDNAAQTWVSVDQTHRKFWTTVVSGDETAPLTQNFDDITLQAGGDAFLLFVQDQDDDGLFLRDENLVGTSDQNKDSDGDGLNDYFEVKTGWTVKPPEALPPLYPHHVFSNPTLADADNDGFSDSKEKARDSDPNNLDTDGDRLCDGSGSAANTSGPCIAGVTPDPKPLVPRFALVSESPKPYSITTKPSDNTISVTFSVPIKATSSFGVRSNVRGPLYDGSFSFSNGGRTITFTPKDDGWWLPGEKLTVALWGITSENTGKPLPVYQYSFRAATNAAGHFDTPHYSGELHGGIVAQTAASGDFNQDGLLDLALTTTNDSPSGGPWQVMADLQTGSGFSLQPPYTLTTGNASTVRQALAIKTGDFNNDDRLDLAVTVPTKDAVAVLLAGETVGGFSDPVFYATGKWPTSLAIADFNGDGSLDLVTANRHDTNANGNSVLLGNGDGTFQAAKPAPSGPQPDSVATGDVNGDGIPDIITSFVGTSPGGVFVNLGNGNGTFRQTGKSQPYPAQLIVYAIATGDFNHDGRLDVATANLNADSRDSYVLLLLNDADSEGTFTATPATEIAVTPAEIMTADFNGDGRLDIAVSNIYLASKAATVLYGSGSEVYTFSAEDIDLSSAPRGPLQAFGLTTTLVGTSGNDANTKPLTLVLVGSSPDNPQGQLVFVSAPAQ